MKPGIFLAVLLISPLLFLSAQQTTAALSFGLKSAPPDLTVSLNGAAQKPVSEAAGIRSYRVDGGGNFRFGAQGYRSVEYSRENLPIKNGLLEIKLEIENGKLKLLGEYSTGVQPKSAYWAPDGKRLFVPLLGQRGVDVFRFEQSPSAKMIFEKRLPVNESGNVEALTDARRRELWISNMEENKVYIFNLDTLEFKTSFASGGVFPKVIVQNPSGDLTLVSNWVSQNLSVFNSQTKELLRRIAVGGTPRGMSFSPDGNLLYVAIYDEAVVEVVDMKQNKVTARYRLYPGEGACRHVICRDGKLYVSDMYRGTVNILNAADGKLLVSRRIGYNINTIILSPDGKRVFASSRGKNNPNDYTKPGPELGAVYMLNANDLTVEERVWGRNQPTGLAVSPDGKFLVFTDFLDANLELYAIK
jgi:DNA-binding beta-propeller fold protein YncE